MTIENIFPTKIYSTIIENVDEVQLEISKILDTIDFLQSGKLRGYANKITDVQRDAITDYHLDITYTTITDHLKLIITTAGNG